METQTDKTEEIQNLISQILKTPDQAFELAQQLDSYGPDIVDPILFKLRIMHDTENEFPAGLGNRRISSILYLINESVKFAEPRHAMQLVEMLLWNEIARTHAHYNILRALRRIGNDAVVPLIAVFNEAEKWYQKEIEETIAACKQRPAK